MYIIKVSDDAIVQLLTQGNITHATKCLRGLPPGAELVGVTLQPTNISDYRIVELNFNVPGHDGIEVLDTQFEKYSLPQENNDADDDLA